MSSLAETKRAVGKSLRLRGVGVRFANEWTLADVDLACDAGSFVSILGPSGCGKSTLLRVIAGLLTPAAGTLAFDDVSGQAFSDRDVSFVFQDAALLPWRNVRDNIGLPLELRREPPQAIHGAATAARQLVGLDIADENKLPRMLSGGMRMRVSLARALVTHPRLLLLDEPLAAVDDVLREVLLEELLQLWHARRWTCLLVTHNVGEAVFASQRVLVMARNPGRLVADIPIPFAYPRAAELRDTSEFAQVTGQVRRALRESMP